MRSWELELYETKLGEQRFCQIKISDTDKDCLWKKCGFLIFVQLKIASAGRWPYERPVFVKLTSATIVEEVRKTTFLFLIVMVTGGSSFPSEGTGDKELDTIGELTSNLQSNNITDTYCITTRENDGPI